MQRIPVVLTLGVALLGAVPVGCGPSLRRVQESHVYFERCYSADFDPRIPLAEKHACWTSWREHYTIGQAQDRVRYARDRVRAIEQGESVPHLPGLPEAAIGPHSTTAMTVSSTEIMTDPPPRVSRAALRRARRPPPMPRTSNDHCAAIACEPHWTECIGTCAEHDTHCRSACEVEVIACARGCF